MYLPALNTTLYEAWNPLDDLLCEEVSGELDLLEMEDLGVATRSLLDRYAIKADKPLKEVKVFGSEVGDDRVDASRDPTLLACALVVQERVVKMRTSEEDTALSLRYWNFCEVSSFVPADPYQSYDYARRNGEFNNLGFNDSLVLRIIMDVSKGDMSHSSTPVGKMTLLGTKGRTPRAEHQLPWNMASWLQDAYLRTSHAAEPKYLPSIMGGAGVQACFNAPENLFLYVRAYRGGRYGRIYGTCTSELQRCLQEIESGRTSVPFLSYRMRERQEYFHGTYAEKVFIPKESITDDQRNLPMPLYEATGAANRFQSYENRLVRVRKIIPRSEAVKDQLQTDRLRHVLLSHYGTVEQAERYLRDQSRVVRSKWGMALSANTALQHLLTRKAGPEDVSTLLGDDAFRVLTTGEREFLPQHAEWIYRGGKSETYSILDLTTSEDMFVRSEVSSEETLKVPGIRLRPIVGNTIKPTTTKAKVGLYQINSSMEEWAENLTDRLISARDLYHKPVSPSLLLEEFRKDPEWVNDDSLLIRQAIVECGEGNVRNQSALLVSRDRRLANQMSNQANLNVYRLDPDKYVSICWKLSIDPVSLQRKEVHKLLPYLSFRRGTERPLVFIDTGSLASEMSNLASTDDGTLVRRNLIECTNTNGERVTKYTLFKTEEPVRLRMECIVPIQKGRRFRLAGRSLLDNYRTSYNADTGSWRTRSESDRSA